MLGEPPTLYHSCPSLPSRRVPSCTPVCAVVPHFSESDIGVTGVHRRPRCVSVIYPFRCLTFYFSSLITARSELFFAVGILFPSVHACRLFSLIDMVSRSLVCSFPSYLPPISIRSHEVRLFTSNVCAQSSHHSANTYMSVFQMPCVRIYVPRGTFIPTRGFTKDYFGRCAHC